jgi:hypothetical protein
MYILKKLSFLKAKFPNMRTKINLLLVVLFLSTMSIAPLFRVFQQLWAEQP